MIKTLTAALALTALASLATAAEPVKMSSAELDTVVAGTYGCTYGCEPVKGNNGWGNGADGTNAGSDEGPNALSKLGDPVGSGLNVDGATGINLNPVSGSTGR